MSDEKIIPKSVWLENATLGSIRRVEKISIQENVPEDYRKCWTEYVPEYLVSELTKERDAYREALKIFARPQDGDIEVYNFFYEDILKARQALNQTGNDK